MLSYRKTCLLYTSLELKNWENPGLTRSDRCVSFEKPEDAQKWTRSTIYVMSVSYTHLKERFGALTLLIKRPGYEPIQSNHADRDVDQFDYDYTIVKDVYKRQAKG